MLSSQKKHAGQTPVSIQNNWISPKKKFTIFLSSHPDSNQGPIDNYNRIAFIAINCLNH